MLRTWRLFSLHVCALAALIGLAGASPLQAQTTALRIDSQPGDPLGQGIQRTYTPFDGTFRLTPNFGGWAIAVEGPNFSFRWSLTFGPEPGATLGVGTYESARRIATPSRPQLEVSRGGSACGAVAGRFVVREIVFDPFGNLTAFAADFEQHCDLAIPALFGAIRYQSSIGDLTPFGGAYPRYQLTVLPSDHGRITGSGIDCGGGATACQVTLSQAMLVTIAATPDPGYFLAGWTGHCGGISPEQMFLVFGPQVCGAVFEPFVTSAPRTLLAIDSQPGDTVGGGMRSMLSGANSVWSVTPLLNGNAIEIRATDYAEDWRINIQSEGTAPLAVGTYGAARLYYGAPFNGLVAMRSATQACARLTGRFVIREIVFGAGGTIARLAVDFEQHCNDANPGLFGSLRYNSTVSEVAPFGGAYPVYGLTLSPPDHGRVSGPSIDCGGAGAACSISMASPASVTLSALADPGYVFMGWSGDCRGGALSVTVNVNGPKACGAQFEPFLTASPRTLLFMDSQPGDLAGAGRRWYYTPANSFWIPGTFLNGNSVSFMVFEDDRTWQLFFSAPSGQALAAGAYSADGPSDAFSRLSVTIFGESCGGSGRFVIHEIAFDSSGSVERFAADFEQHCGDAGPALFGAIRFNAASGSVVPFDGIYPQYQLTLQPPSHGRITSAELNCGTGGASCAITLPSPARLTLMAEPDAGYVFAGWTGNCRGPAVMSLHVNGPKVCGAQFEPRVSSAPRTLLYLASEPAEPLGLGGTWAYTPANSQWRVFSAGMGQSILATVGDPSESWTLHFSAPAGETLAIGEYNAARASSTTAFNGFRIHRASAPPFCSSLTGRFVILDLAIASDGTVQRFAADFEQHCNDGVPGLFGSIRYNSSVGDSLPFAGVFPLYRLAVAPPSHGRVTGTDLDCGGAATACTRTLAAAALVTVTAVPDAGHVFMGWTDDCGGGLSTTIHVNGPKRCAASFAPIVATSPRTVLRWQSVADGAQPAASGVLSAANSRWSATGSPTGQIVQFEILSVGLMSNARWSVELAAPTGEPLLVGRRYATTAGVPGTGTASLAVSWPTGSCAGGEFIVRDIALGPQNTVSRLAADLVAICGNPRSPKFIGSLHYNSQLAAVPTTVGVEPGILRFAALRNNGVVTTQPSAQPARVIVGAPNATWTAVGSQPWIAVSPSVGTGTSAMTIGVDVLGADPATVSAPGSVTVTPTDGTGTSRTIDIAVTLHLIGTTTAPFGFVDTPLQNATGVTGAIPMTGWALDDIEVEDVTICRLPTGGEAPAPIAICGGQAEIFVGSGVFVEGARPDVGAAFPNHPRAGSAGWGFMLLTNMLPNAGNGTFVFRVYARDREGASSLLGTRTMTCDNAHATAPFGTIDTPGQGATVAGSAYLNFGWALTPVPNAIPLDGSTLMVYVDGQPIGRPVYNNYRPDIATLFPGLANSNGAVGYRIIDTRTLSSGLHTISWSVTDSAGVTSGLGSRYFRVVNGAGAALTEGAPAAEADAAARVDDVPIDRRPLVGRRGWREDAAWVQYATGREGATTVRGEELDRFEWLLGAQAGERHDGYLRAGDRLLPLPVGSRLDRGTGTFTWSPGVGFVGAYDLVFVRSENGGAVSRREVRVILAPKGRGHVGADVIIDTPRSQQDVAQPFLFGGWAVDRDATVGTGVEAVHVWAYPLAGGAPVFLGAAAIGGTRPDVAAVLGDQFRDAGYGLTVQGLTPGNYDLAVFAWSGISGGFVPARTVRVTVR